MSMPDKSEELELEGWEEVLETCGTASVGSQLWKRAWRRVSRHHPLDLESVISPGVSRPPFRPSLNNQSLWDRATSVLAAMDAAVPLEECSDDRQPPHRSRSADILPPELHDCIHRLRLLPSYGAPSLGLDLLSFAYPCRPSVVYTHDIPHIHIPSDNQTPLSAPHTLDTVVCLVRPSTAGQPPSLIAGYVYTDQSKTLASAWAFDVPRLELTVFEYNLTDSAKPLVKQAVASRLLTFDEPPGTLDDHAQHARTSAGGEDKSRGRAMLSRDGEIEGMGEGSLRLADAVVWNFKRVALPPAVIDQIDPIPHPLIFQPDDQQIAAALIHAILSFLADLSLPLGPTTSLSDIVTASSLELEMELLDPSRISRRSVRRLALLFAAQVVTAAEAQWGLFQTIRDDWATVLDSVGRAACPPFTPISVASPPIRPKQSQHPENLVDHTEPPHDHLSPPAPKPVTLALPDPLHPRFADIQPPSILNVPLDPSQLTLDSLRYGHPETGRPPFFGADRRPFLIRSNIDSVGGRVPDDLTPHKIAEILGRDEQMSVQPIGTWRVHDAEKMAIGTFCDQLVAGTAKASLLTLTAHHESALGRLVRPPQFAFDLHNGKEAPACTIIMSPAGAFTPWHVDSTGSSGWTYIPEGQGGAKVWYFAAPTAENLAQAVRSCGPDGPGPTTLQLQGVYAIEQRAGDILWMPSGFLHAVYTIEPTCMFTGDFMTSFDYPSQIQTWRYEEQMGYDLDDRSPNFLTTRVLEIRRWTTVLETFMPFADGSTIGDRSVLRPAMPDLEDLRALCTFLQNEMLDKDSVASLTQGIRKKHVNDECAALERLVRRWNELHD